MWATTAVMVALLLGVARGQTTEQCENTCPWPGNSVCNDGGPGAQDSSCYLGTDCWDCAPAVRIEPHSPAAIGRRAAPRPATPRTRATAACHQPQDVGH